MPCSSGISLQQALLLLFFVYIRGNCPLRWGFLVLSLYKWALIVGFLVCMQGNTGHIAGETKQFQQSLIQICLQMWGFISFYLCSAQEYLNSVVVGGNHQLPGQILLLRRDNGPAQREIFKYAGRQSGKCLLRKEIALQGKKIILIGRQIAYNWAIGPVFLIIVGAMAKEKRKNTKSNSQGEISLTLRINSVKSHISGPKSLLMQAYRL